MSQANRVDDRTLLLTRELDVPRARVFAAGTTPEQVAQWWEPEGCITEHCEMDIRRGGMTNTVTVSKMPREQR
jgi:uncharacterized protein YndB with AHSA1/START domain